MNFFKELKKPWRFLQSRRFTIIILLMSVIFTVTGVIVPQKNLDPQQYELWALNNPGLKKVISFLSWDTVFTSWYFYLLGVLLFINTLLCTINQVKTLLKLNAGDPLTMNRVTCEAFFRVTRYKESGDLLGRITQFFESRHYLVQPRGWENGTNKAIIAWKGLWGSWGIIIFHLSILVILGSVYYGSLTRMEGIAYIGVGQTFTDRPQDYNQVKQGPFFSEGDYKNFQMTLDQAKLNYFQGYPDVENLRLRFLDSELGTSSYEGKGEDIEYRGSRIFIDNVGYAPAIVITNTRNQIIYGTFKKIRTIFHLGNKVTYQDELDIPQFGFKVLMEFYPDAVVKGKNIYTKSPQPRNPLLSLKVLRGGRVIYEGSAKAGSKIKLTEDLFLAYPEYRNWVSFRFVRDNTPVGIFTGFFISIAGLALYYLVLPRMYLVTVEEVEKGAVVNVFGYAGKFKEAFKDRFKGTIEQIQREIEYLEETDHV